MEISNKNKIYRSKIYFSSGKIMGIIFYNLTLVVTFCALASMLVGCESCYDTYEDAWEACNEEYNGKCSYLGPKYKICDDRKSSTNKRELDAAKIEALLMRPSSADVFFLKGEEAFDEKDYSKAKSYLIRASEAGSTSANNFLGYMYSKGLGVAIDAQKAVYWYEKAANFGDLAAQCNLGIKYLRGEGVTQNYAIAFQWFTKSASQGDSRAQNELGRMYSEGLGMQQNYEQSTYWFQKACEQKNIGSCFSLANAYSKGQGVKQDLAFAVKLWKEIAQNADTGSLNSGEKRCLVDAQFNLGLKYQHGQGVKTDIDQAIFWFLKAGESDDTEAMVEAGLLLEHEKKNFSEALSLYEKAAVKGNVKGMYLAGVFYNKGRGVPVDFCKAVSWYELAAEKGSAPAQHNLANRYLNGECVTQSQSKAMELYRLAAEQGFELSVEVIKQSTE